VLGIHGITASSLALAPLARHVDAEHTLAAPDLRGRGASAGLAGPYGLRVHAEDCARVLESVATGPVTVVGESMGAFVAVALAAARPELIERLVLVDGGLPLSLPAGASIEVVAATVLGPALTRLRQTFPSRQAYRDFWRAHPAFVGEWNDDIQAYVDYDLTGAEPTLRSRAVEAAVVADAADTLAADVTATALRRLSCPVHLLRAARNLLNERPALVSDDLVATWRRVVRQLTDEVVEDTNHYTIMFGERGAKAVAERAFG
jgi:pimeloyl-ACP methyl ester carboxylesterase